MPRLSIIVPVYKVEKYIHKCVDSILNQTFTDFELILVDDGSPDNCGRICDEYAEKDSRVRVIHKKNGGLSDARNHGIDVSKGEILSFVDSDDWIAPVTYEKVIGYLDSNGLDIVHFDVCEVKNGKEYIAYHGAENQVLSGKEALYDILVDKIDNSACDKVFKKTVFSDVRFPYGRKYEDVSTVYKAFNNADRIGYYKGAFYYYLKREGSIVATSFNATTRYDSFLGYKERYYFAMDNCQKAVELCKMFAVKAALSCITAESAGCGHISDENREDLYCFLRSTKRVHGLNAKNQILLWGALHCRTINKLYGKLSYFSKKLK